MTFDRTVNACSYLTAVATDAEMQWSETSQTTTAPSETITNPAPIPLFVTLLEDDQPANETNESGTVSETEKNFDVTRGPNEQSRDTVQLQMNSKSSDISAALPPEAHRKRVAECKFPLCFICKNFAHKCNDCVSSFGLSVKLFALESINQIYLVRQPERLD